MKRALLVSGGALLALTSAFAVAQDSPESLLPPGFERPKPAASRPQAAPVTVNRPASGATATVSVPVVQPLPGEGGAARGPALPSGMKIPSLKELEAMSPAELDEALGLKPKSDMPPAARRAMKQLGILAVSEGGFPAGTLAAQDSGLVQAVLDGNKGPMVSRWGHILVRRALASRLDAPARMNAADFVAKRAALLVRMGEGEAARALVQDVDAGNYSPALTQAAIDAYVFTADLTGACPMVNVQGGARKDADWRVLRAICSAFQGDGTGGLTQLDRMMGGGEWPKVDLLLAQKYAGAAGKARRAVKIEWDEAEGTNPWRYALTTAVGLEPPAALMRDAALRYRYSAATAPMLGLETRADAADDAGAAGILSSAAMVDLYSQIYALGSTGSEAAGRADKLRLAYVAETPEARLEAMTALWNDTAAPRHRYARQVLTAYAAARLPVSASLAKSAPDLLGSMLSAGLDANALRWAAMVDQGSIGWGVLAVAAPRRGTAVESGMLDSFKSNDDSEDYRKTQFLVAALAGLDRIDPAAARNYAASLDFDLARQTRWTKLIDSAADANNAGLVSLLAGLGMQGQSWEQMTGLHLYHIVSALNRVGLGAEARMIAAEAIARG